jgi:anti-sigma factor RsiW
MVTLRQVRRAAEREEQFRAMQHALRRTFDYVAAEPVPERLRALIETLERRLTSTSDAAEQSQDQVGGTISTTMFQLREPS